jgi:hypothetical protein
MASDDREPTEARPGTDGDESATTHQDRVNAGEDRVDAGEDRVDAGEGHADRLERRSRLLLRAYPAAYRRDRGEEIIGTLLEATPAGRTWPRLRDARAMAFGGLQARAAQNRQLTPSANLRIAVMTGVSIYLVMIAAEYIGTWVIDPGPFRYEWRVIAVGLAILTAVLPAWIAPRRLAALIVLAAATAIYFVGGDDVQFWSWISLVVSLAAIVLLAPRSARPPRAWLWLIGAFAVAVVATIYGSAGFLPEIAPLIALGVVSVAWIVIDARLAVAVATFMLTFYVERAAVYFNAAVLPYVLATVAIAVLPVWLLRRQSAPRARPR